MTHILLASVEAVAAAKKAQKEMYGALLSKRELLVEDLESKLSAYKDLLLKEMVTLKNFSVYKSFMLSYLSLTQQITGVPPEGLTAEEIEKMRTKFGINYKFSKFVLDKSDSIVSHNYKCNRIKYFCSRCSVKLHLLLVL